MLMNFTNKLYIRLKITFTAILIIAVLIFVLFLQVGGSWLVVDTPLQQADTIVMLRGSSPERELEVVNIVEKKYANKILFVHFMTNNSILLDSIGLSKLQGAEQNITILTHLGVSENNIIMLEGEVSNTRGEALAVRKYLETHDHIRSIILVSSPPHMRRSRLIFRKELRKLDRNVDLVLRPSSYSDFKPQQWYRHRESSRSVVLEYLKLAGWFVGM